MDAALIRQLGGLNDAEAVSAFNRILAERPGERATLLKTFRAHLPDLYGK